ncbi:MAG: hypothetical protein R3B72_38790 [Polyangiaceae bacterium]
MDGKFTDADLSSWGTGFASSYYDARYLADYEAILGAGVANLYHVPDSWETLDRLAPTLDAPCHLARFTAIRSKTLMTVRTPVRVPTRSSAVQQAAGADNRLQSVGFADLLLALAAQLRDVGLTRFACGW